MIWEEILFYSLLYLGLLYIIGHPTLVILRRFPTVNSLLEAFDPVERLPIEFVVGGAVVYSWCLIATPFGAFTYASSWILTLIFVALNIAVLFRDQPNLNNISKYSWAALGAFFLGLIFRIVPMQGYILGSVTDSALHTLFVYSIIRVGGIPQSVFSGSVLQFPQGLHAVLAYFSMISGLPPELVTFYELAFFNATILLAVYCLGKVLVSKQFALILVLILLIISVYPIAITWGGQIIPWGFTIFFVSLALIFQKFVNADSLRMPRDQLMFVLPGILLGYLASTYAPLFALLFIILFLVMLLEHKQFLRQLQSISILIVASLPLFGIWIFRYVVVSNYNTPYLVNESSSAAFNAALVAGKQWFPYKYMTSIQAISQAIYNWVAWPVQVHYPGSTVLLTVLVIIGSGVMVLAIFSRNHLSLPRNLLYYVLGALITILIWGADNPVGLFYYASGSFSILTTELNKATAIAGTILTPFIAAVPIYVLLLLAAQGKILRPKHRKYVAVIVFSALIVANLVIVPFGEQWLTGNYGVYAVTSNSDYQLLKWMRTGIPDNAVVLVNPYDAGQYVQSIANKTALGTFTGITYPSLQYQRVFTLLAHGIVNQTTVSLLKTLNVSYIFVGSRAIQFGWNPELFITHCLSFKVVQNYYNSFLFQVISTQVAAASVTCNYI